MLVLEQVVVLWTRKCPTLRWRTVPGAFVMHCISHLSRDPDIAKPHTFAKVVGTVKSEYIWSSVYFWDLGTDNLSKTRCLALATRLSIEFPNSD